MRTVIAVPWREGPGRKKWFDAVKRHYATHFRDWQLIEVDAGGEEFSRAATRNLAVKRAADLGADVVVINDADTLAKSASIREAVAAAAKGGLHLPFETCVVKRGNDADSFVANVNFPASGGFASTGGIYVVRPDQWQAFGGSDENFKGWGGEDDQVVAAAQAIIGFHRHQGVAVSLGHNGERLANPHYAENMLRVRAYQALADDREGMHALLARRDSIVSSAKKLPSRVAVIAPSRGRPANIERLWRSMQETALRQVSLLVGLDEDDEPNYPRVPGVRYFVKPRQRLNDWWNELALAHLDEFDTFIFAGDDNVMVTPGWDFLLDDELRMRDDVGFATGPDGLRRDKNFTWAAISSRQIREVGYVGPPGLIHLCIDTAWQYLAGATGTMYWLDHVLIEHMHYSRSGAGVVQDETYKQANAVEVNRKDRETVEKWRRSPEFSTAVEVIKKLQSEPWARPVISSTKEEPPSGTISLPFIVTVGGEQVATGTVRIPVIVKMADGRPMIEAQGDLLELVKGAM